jgi:N4-gp56 family major capsid protein
MAIQTAGSSTGIGVQLSNSVRQRYTDQYEEEVYYQRLYDQFAVPYPDLTMATQAQDTNAVTYHFLSKMDIPTTNISETVDVTPQALKDATATISKVSRGAVLQISQQMNLQNFLQNYMGKLTAAVSENAAETIDLLARDAATQGTMVSRAAARASLDAGSTAHNLTETRMLNAANRLAQLKCPVFKGIVDNPASKSWGAVLSPFAFADLRSDTNIVAVGQYQNQGIVMNWEVGSYGPYRLLVSPWAKIFYGAGADAADVVDTTYNASASTKLDLTFSVAANTHMDQCVDTAWLAIGTEETANTHYTDNERVWLTGFTGSTATIVGEGPNAGLRFSHPATTPVRNADSVHTVVIGGPASMVKVYAPNVGEFGEVVGPLKTGNLEQFWSLGWKWWGGHGRISENRLMRIEVSASDEVWT